MDPAIFDRRAVTWAGIYPRLDPQKIIHGSQNQCMSCAMIKEALHSIGLDLDMTHNEQNLLLGLHHQGRNGSLVLSAKSHEGYDLVELYTVSGQSFFPLWMVLKLYMIHQVLELHDYATN